MNNSQFTIKELKKAIVVLLKQNKGVFSLTCMGIFKQYIDSSYPEFSFDKEIDIKSVDEINGDVSIEFSQTFYLDEEMNEGFEYETLQSIQDIKKVLNE